MANVSTATPAKGKKAKAEKPKEMGRHRETGIIEEWKRKKKNFSVNPKATIKVLVRENPKSGSAKARYEVYGNGKKVETCMAEGVTKADLCWDEVHGFIQIVPPAKKEAKDSKESKDGHGKADHDEDGDSNADSAATT